VDQGATGLGTLSDNGREPEPITVWKFGVNDEKGNLKAVAREIFRLLDTDVKITGLHAGDRKIRPGDIGVLVRDNREGDIIKNELAKYNIPSVKRDDKKVLDSDEANMVRYLLKAVITPNRGDINRALLSKYVGFDFESVRNIDDEKHTDIFIGLKKTLREEGIYNMISEFLTVYDVRSKCMNDVMGQRVLSNINQIAELLHRAEKQWKYTPDELHVWMQRGPGETSEEFEQRVESDEDAIQISTIHKAKGLEYNIVFAPCLCMLPRFKHLAKNNVNDFKKKGKYYFTFNYSALSPEDQEILNTQKEQENRRLIYVALTRPVYKCYISYMPRAYFGAIKQSSMDEMFERYNNGRPDLINIIDLSQERIGDPDRKFELPATEKKEFYSKPALEIEIKNSFGIHSYSALSKAHHAAPFEKAELGNPEDYDQFIFQELGRGASVGTALHSIFERLAFSNPTTWIQTILETSKFYPNIIKKKDEEKNITGNIELIHQITSVPLKVVVTEQVRSIINWD
jgi:exodeoxyribonuclease V beta subunit